MPFKKKFAISKQYLTPNTKRRSGLACLAVRFLVAHDTGNAGSTAKNNVDYYERTNNKESASAHIFVDDKVIIECIPSIGDDTPEKAWHVRYKMTKDNEFYGSNANDTAIGVEYCFGGAIDATKSYAKYIWTLAYLCDKYKLKPDKDIVGHFMLDPGRKTDPESSLKLIGKTYQNLLRDVTTEYNDCLLGDERTKPIKDSVVNKINSIDKNNKKNYETNN